MNNKIKIGFTEGPFSVTVNLDHCIIANEAGTVAYTVMHGRPFPYEPEGEKECHERMVATANLMAAAPELLRLLQSAHGALRSYQYGNGATELAQNIADACEKVIIDAGGKTLL